MFFCLLLHNDLTLVMINPRLFKKVVKTQINILVIKILKHKICLLRCQGDVSKLLALSSYIQSKPPRFTVTWNKKNRSSHFCFQITRMVSQLDVRKAYSDLRTCVLNTCISVQGISLLLCGLNQNVLVEVLETSLKHTHCHILIFCDLCRF